VNNADFTQAVFVNISAQQQNTKQVYTYINFQDTNATIWRLCVVGHTHRNINTGQYTEPANCFIPGWNGDQDNGWAMATPQGKIVDIANAPVGGVFPGNNRYPTPV
jgi:hypothetical protein